MLQAVRRIAARSLMVSGLVVSLLATPPASAQDREQAAAQPSGGLSAEELDIEPFFDGTEDPVEPPVAAADATDVRIEPVVETGYFDEQGRYVVDLIEDDYTYLSVRVETANGQPVEGAEPRFALEGTSRLLEPKDVSTLPMTNEYGIVEFAVVAGQMGLDRIAVEYGNVGIEILVNIISFRATTFTMPTVAEGLLSWDDLMQAQVRYEDMTLLAEFPASVTERSGETVKMAGFMTPLETDTKQNWFLLTTHPSSCFFHIPGGPSGVVEVFAEEGIEVSWDPIVLEGRFEALEKSDSAVYRLHDARIVGR